MGKELKNIDELYRSELGGSVTQAPDFVKKNIDSALGFRKRKTGYLLLGLIALLTTVGITAAVITNMDDTDQVAQSNMDADDSFETVDNSSASNNAVTELQPTDESSNTVQSSSDGASESEVASTYNPSAINTNNSDNSSSNYAVNNNENQASNDAPVNRDRFANQNTGNSNANTVINAGATQPDPVNTNTVSQNSNQQVNNTTGQQENNTTSNTGENSQLADNNNTASLGDNPTQPDLADNTDTDNNENNTNTESNSLAVNTDSPNNTTDDTSSDTDNDLSDNQTNSDPDINETNTAATETSSTDNGSTTTTEDNSTAANTDSNTDADATNDTSEPPTVIEQPVEDDYKPFMISLTSGVNILRSNYTSESMNEETLYENALNDRIGNQTNLDITYRLKNGLTFGSGLGLNTYDESYEFTTYESYFDTTEVFETIIYDTSDYPVDTVYTYAYDVLQKGTQVSGRNKASYFTLPVHLGTQMRFNKFQLDIYATARLNFLMRSSGGYYNNNEVVSFGKENSIYKPFYVDVLFASKVHYNLLNNLYLTGTVQYRPVMGNSFKEVSFNKTFDYMHFGLGLSLRL